MPEQTKVTVGFPIDAWLTPVNAADTEQTPDDGPRQERLIEFKERRHFVKLAPKEETNA